MSIAKHKKYYNFNQIKLYQNYFPNPISIPDSEGNCVAQINISSFPVSSCFISLHTPFIPDSVGGFVLLWWGWGCYVITRFWCFALLTVKKSFCHSCLLLLPLCLWSYKKKKKKDSQHTNYTPKKFKTMLKKACVFTGEADLLVGWSSNKCCMSEMSSPWALLWRLLGLEDSSVIK